MNTTKRQIRLTCALAAIAVAWLALVAVPAARAAAKEPRSVKIEVTDKGFEPQQFELRMGEHVRLAFLRTSKTTCATAVQSKDLGIPRTELPLGKSAVVELTPNKAGKFTFVCGANMLSGTVIVKAP